MNDDGGGEYAYPEHRDGFLDELLEEADRLLRLARGVRVPQVRVREYAFRDDELLDQLRQQLQILVLRIDLALTLASASNELRPHACVE